VPSRAARPPADDDLHVLLESWRLGEESTQEVDQLLEYVAQQREAGPVHPRHNDLFAAFRFTTYDSVKVVILGQDPYHQPGQANGLCFSVPRDLSKLPPSLRNIHIAMANAGFTPPDHGDLTGWAEQGVLLLNTALTVREGEPNSHAKVWRAFTDAVIRKLDERERPVVFVLWGRFAQRKAELLEHNQPVTAPHPASRGESQAEFRKGTTFLEVNERLEALGEKPIRWDIE
jgi:uracil-DNA glycosylase